MKKLLFLSLACFSLSTFAETIVSRIHSINVRDGFIRLTSGRVAFLNSSSLTIGSIEPGDEVRLVLDDENNLKRIEVIEKSRRNDLTFKSLSVPERPSYTPSVLPNLETAVGMFNRMRSDFKRVSECSDRAHVWAYDEFKSSGTKSNKVFVLFTASYINRNKFKWWFHVAPVVEVNEGGAVQSRVMDFRYTDRPLLIKEWTDMLVFSKRTCKMTTKFSEYDVNPQTEDCYMMIESMYYRIPGDIYNQELNNEYRDGFSDSEVNFARNLAFEATTVGAIHE